MSECECEERRVLALTGKKGSPKLEEAVGDMTGCCIDSDSKTMSLDEFYDADKSDLNLKQYDYVMISHGLAKALYEAQL